MDLLRGLGYPFPIIRNNMTFKPPQWNMLSKSSVSTILTNPCPAQHPLPFPHHACKQAAPQGLGSGVEKFRSQFCLTWCSLSGKVQSKSSPVIEKPITVSKVNYVLSQQPKLSSITLNLSFSITLPTNLISRKFAICNSFWILLLNSLPLDCPKEGKVAVKPEIAVGLIFQDVQSSSWAFSKVTSLSEVCSCGNQASVVCSIPGFWGNHTLPKRKPHGPLPSSGRLWQGISLHPVFL